MFVTKIKILDKEDLAVLADRQNIILGFISKKLALSTIKEFGKHSRTAGYFKDYHALYPGKEGIVWWFDINDRTQLNIPQRYIKIKRW